MMKSHPDLKLLKTFLAVVHEGSMTRAALALGYVPSAVSQQIAALELLLKTELLVRKPGSRIELTATGRSVLQAADRLFAATAEFQDIVEDAVALETGVVRVGTYATAMCYLLPQVLAKMNAEGPGPKIHLREIETPQALPLVRSGELDLLVAYRYLPEDPPTPSPEMRIIPIATEPIHVIAHEGPNAPATLSECLDHDWVSGHPELDERRLIQRWAGEHGLPLRVHHETIDPHGSLSMVAAGLAVSTIAVTVLRPALQAGRPVRIISMPPGIRPLHREILMITRASFRAPIVARLVELLATELTEKSAEVKRLAGRRAAVDKS